MRLGILCSRIRVEEKLIFAALKKRGILFDKIDDRELVIPLGRKNPLTDYDVILERCINHSRALYTLAILNDAGVKTVNTYKVARICGDKLLTTQALLTSGVASPKSLVAYTPESALQAIEEIGYPAVLKPCIGSWGRLIAKVTDRSAAEAILEHKQILGSYHHSIYYIQEYINKPSRDIRVFVVDGEPIAGIYRNSDHWITNTALGAKTTKCELSPELSDLAVRAAEAVGGGVVAVDILESDDGYLVCEVNYTMEFRNSIDVTGVDIPGCIVDYVIKTAKQ